MSLSNLVPSMFHRRLMLLLACTVGATGVLAAQMARLTLLQGEAHKADAEAKLVRRQWIQTLRGRILDRHGRVLAQDRPSFDLAVEYPVITGEWARQRAYWAAKKVYGRRWGQLSAEEREQIVQSTYLPLYREHLDRAWSLFARTSGLSFEKVAERRAAVVGQVEGMFSAIRARRWDAAFEAFLAEGRSLDEEAERSIQRRIAQPIREQSAPHVIAPRVPDDVGFAFMQLAQEQVKIPVPRPGEDGEGGAAGAGGVYEDTVGLIPGLSVVNAHDRDYPFERVEVDVETSSLPSPMRGPEGEGGLRRITVEGVATHVVGWMRNEAQEEHVARRRERLAADAALRQRATEGGAGDRGQYMPGDAVGAAGIEAAAEHALRGLRGLRVEQLETGEQSFIDPVAGRDVRLTIDVALQARVQAAMTPELGLATVQPWHGPENPKMPRGTPLNGGAVVLEVDTGDILALVSTPGLPRRVLREDPASLFEDQINQPFFHRAISRPYPPGSIAKALVLCGAVKLGVLNLDHHIECNGHLFPNSPDMLRCWIYKSYQRTHSGQFGGALDAIRALTVSCNIYFFTLGQRLGPEGIEAVYRMFGVGEAWDLGLGHEFKGSLGVYATDDKGRTIRDEKTGEPKVLPITPGDAIQMGIGQGPIAWTALHAADAYATIARGGVRIKPRVVLGDPDGRGSEPPVDLGLDPRVIAEALKGLEGSVNDTLGTGHHISVEDPATGQSRREAIFNAPGVQVWGKTGTADAPDLKIDTNGDGKLIDEVAVRSGDHSWFVVLVGRKGEGRPRYAIAVMMEYAGSGGKVSGPIVNQIIHALIAEGYL